MLVYKIRPGAGIESLSRSEIPSRPLATHEVRVRIHAVSLNYRDVVVAQGTYPISSEEPVIPVSDAAGEVLETGSGVTRFARGDRVATSFFPNWVDGEPTPEKTADSLGASGCDGALAEEVVQHEQSLVLIPTSLNYIQAATLTCAGLTAWSALFGAGSLKPGDTVLLLGTGGVSIWALQLAKAAGLRSIVTSSSDTKLERAKSLGATETINYRKNPEWQQDVQHITQGRGVDLVAEVGGTLTLARSVNCVRAGGSVAIIGGVSGFGGEFQPFSLIAGARKLLGILVGNRMALEQLVRFVDVARIQPVIDRVFRFDEAIQAYDYLQSGAHFGKVVIQVV
jgi:NADPH:quinone reductase-like Zn-dependent oxidoreductase